MENTFTILAGRLDEAKARMKKFEKKAKRYGIPFSVSWGDVYQEERPVRQDSVEFMLDWAPRRKRTVMVNVLDVTITGEKPVVGDFEFQASVELTDAGNYVDMVPGVELDPRYRTTDNRCEHCHHDRQRKHVFIVRNKETNEFLQVGRTCLRDFLGTDDPRWIIQSFKFWREFRGGGDDKEGWGSLGRYKWSDTLDSLLTTTLACVRIWGWTSKGAARYDDELRSTASRVMMTYQRRDKWNAEDLDKIAAARREEDWDTANQIIEWVRASEDTSDYMWNLRLSFTDDLLSDERRIGLAISAVQAWHRAQERELKLAREREQNAVSRHVGEVKERLRGLKVRIEMRRGMGDNGFGWTELLKMRDEDGNLFTWFTGAAPSADIGETWVIDGTVKALKEYNGAKETQLTRVKVLREEVAA